MAVGDGPSHCDGCGLELNPGARFCRNCGHSVSTAVNSPSPGGVATATLPPDVETGPAADEKTTSNPVVSPVAQPQEPASGPTS